MNWDPPKNHKYGKKLKHPNWDPPKISKCGKKLKYSTKRTTHCHGTEMQKQRASLTSSTTTTMLSAAVFAMKKRARKCHKALGGTFEGRRVWVKLSVSGQCPSATKELNFGIKFKFVFHT